MAATRPAASPAGDRSEPAQAPSKNTWPSRSSAYLRAFWHRAYRENITGLSAMVAYNLLLAVFPFVLLMLFVVGQVIHTETVETSILSDLRALFPDVQEQTLRDILERIRDNATTIGVIAAVGSIWIGASFWGAMDTAFCRIYHVDCRGWVEQKRFSFVMLIVVMLFLLASVLLPIAEGALVSGTNDLPLGLDESKALVNLLLIVAALGLTFLICCVIFWAVPKGHMPWRDVWPGALFVTATTGIANWAFPFYLGNVSGLSRFGSTLGFILIALLWFYALSLAILAGAVINSLRHEKADTGSLPYAVEEAAGRQ
jgi:membrane protein